MCEWLSSVEWCDVRLSCGGRTFNAHKAVLASVSHFLRRVLLSCPQEETPTFIVLPEFDLDALSSVLYYVYNGEVIVKKQNLLKFLDVIKALEIFIDQQYLQKIRDSVGDLELGLCTYRKSKWSKRVFNLTVGNSNELEYVNIRKGEQLQDIWLRYSQTDSDLGDKRERLSWSDVQPSLDNPPESYRDRQRNSFLRDLYIETYPQNGNVNGLTGGVLAIPNERYRAPTSVLLTNANGKLPSRTDDTLSEISRKTTEHTSYVSNATRTPQLCIQDCARLYSDACSKMHHNLGLFQSTDLINNKRLIDNSYNLSAHLKNPWLSCYPSQLSAQKVQTGIPNNLSMPKMIMPSLDLSQNRSLLDSKLTAHAQPLTPEILYSRSPSKLSCKYPIAKDSTVGSKSLKEPIFNQVLDSPWCPRLPYDYKPFRRKLNNETESEILKKKENEVAIVNDSNNNIEESLIPSTCNKLENVTAVTREEFKCNLCSQVFTTSESLEVHTKRHTVVARYSCAECGKTFSQLRNFKYHMSVHRGTREFAATCTVCGKYFNDRGYLSSHMKIHRNRKEYKCSQCPKSFNQRVAYNMHVRIHTGVKPHVCEECGKAFSRKMLLKQHQRTHSGERPYACPHCDKRFADRSNMTLHLRLHTGIKPFSCTLCPKSFTKKHHLKSHLNFHTGAKPYSCPRCRLAFTQSSNMRTHLKKCSAPEDSAVST
ncbi:zinc finger protein 583-like [Ostrinia furnacalis]|uniref:zinc finger protein 583-like n=1 Tax=Ostrinia furnacalis TaxID=93504 RepID=UPI00103F987F|nr:zinc finger protein 583-like [Ostrinia furnacalis]